MTVKTDHVAHVLDRAVQFIAGDTAISTAAWAAAKGLIVLVRDLVTAHGVEGAETLLRRMRDNPASKVDLTETEEAVERILAAREAADSTPES